MIRMLRQREISYQEKPKKENLSKFKGALKRIKSGIRSRVMPFVLVGSLFAISPAFRHQEAYAQDSITKMEQIKKDYPTLSNEETLLYILYLNHSNTKQKSDEGMKKMIEKVSDLIERNKENRIFCITLNSVMTDILNNSEGRNYCISADNRRIIIRDKMEDATKMMTINISGNNGIKVNVFNLDLDTGKYMTINTGSTSEDVKTLKLEMSKFLGSLLPGIIMINNELDENRKK